MFHVFIFTVLFLQNHRVYLQAHHLNLFLVPFLSQQCSSRSMGSLRQPGSSQGLHMDAQGCRNALPHPSRCFHTGKGFRLIPLLSLQRKGPRNLDVPFPVIAQVPAEIRWDTWTSKPVPNFIGQGAKIPTWTMQHLKHCTELLNSFFWTALPGARDFSKLCSTCISFVWRFAIIKTFSFTKHGQRSY